MRTADVDWQCDLGILYYGDLWEGRLFNIELYATIMLNRLFNGADMKVQIIFRRKRNNLNQETAKKGQLSVLLMFDETVICFDTCILMFC
jgi:hypothetical protein